MADCYDWLQNVPGVPTVVQDYDWLQNVWGMPTVVQDQQRRDWAQDVASFYTTILPVSQFREGLGPIPETIRSVIRSVISRQLTISRSDRIPGMILLRLDHDPGRSCSLRGSVLDLVTIIATLGVLWASRRVASPSIETGLQIWKKKSSQSYSMALTTGATPAKSHPAFAPCG